MIQEGQETQSLKRTDVLVAERAREGVDGVLLHGPLSPHESLHHLQRLVEASGACANLQSKTP
jgi:hypothetical protein